MQVDYLIVGQGICGTMLSWFLFKEGKTFAVIDDNRHDAASRVAGSIINPITGRRYSYSWMIDEIMPFAVQTYKEIGAYFDTTLVHQKSVIDFFPAPQSRLAFIERLSENDSYLHSFPDQNHFNQYFHYEFGCGEIRPAYAVYLQLLLNLWREALTKNGRLIEQEFQPNELAIMHDGISYGHITAEKLIFCDGAAGASNPWFSLLPYGSNKGEALIIECADLTNEHIFKKSLLLAPMAQKDHYWVGSSYQWEFDDTEPSEAFHKQATASLNGWLKGAYKVVDHKAALRPATLERRPFVGFHPVQPAIGILNGMGTKGSSLAPFFANQLAQHLVHGLPITPEADVRRFSRILSRIGDSDSSV